MECLACRHAVNLLLDSVSAPRNVEGSCLLVFQQDTAVYYHDYKKDVNPSKGKGAGVKSLNGSVSIQVKVGIRAKYLCTRCYYVYVHFASP